MRSSADVAGAWPYGTPTNTKCILLDPSQSCGAKYTPPQRQPCRFGVPSHPPHRNVRCFVTSQRHRDHLLSFSPFSTPHAKIASFAYPNFITALRVRSAAKSNRYRPARQNGPSLAAMMRKRKQNGPKNESWKRNRKRQLGAPVGGYIGRPAVREEAPFSVILPFFPMQWLPNSRLSKCKINVLHFPFPIPHQKVPP